MAKSRRPRPKRWYPKTSPKNLPSTLPEFVLKVPEVLNFGPPEVIDALYLYFEELRYRIIILGQRVVIDLRSCRSIGPVGVLLLAAEVERCNFVKPHHVTGYKSISPIVNAHLSMFGFFRAVGITEETPEVIDPKVIQIETGIGRTPRLSENLGRVANLTFDMWGDQAFTDRVHGALNEAMTNVLMHAYDPDLTAQADACESGRWWVAGFGSGDGSHAWFMALDLGVGIPTSATHKIVELQAVLARPTRLNDAAIIKKLVVSEERSRTGLPQHGRGVPTMVSLVRDRTSHGTIWIVSGRGCFLMDKNLNRPDGRLIVDGSFGLKAKASGTLILWKVGQAIVPEHRIGE